MGEKKQRNSNFELLRIFAMILIIIFHIQYHGIEVQLQIPSEYFGSPIFYRRLLIVEMARSFGHVGNAIFFMLSGFFLADKEQIDLTKVCKKLLFQVGYVTVCLMLLSDIWIHFFFGTKRFNYAIDVWFLNYWWFIGWYILVITFATVFLNKFLKNLDSKKYMMFIITLFTLVQFSWSGEQLESLITGLRVTAFGVIAYALGGYLAKYNPFKNVRVFTFVLVLVVTYGIKLLSNYNLTMQSIQNFTDDGTRYFTQNVVGTRNYEALVIIVATCIFEIFRRINIPNSQIINYISASTLMIYMMHENDIFQAAYMDKEWLILLSTRKISYFVELSKWILIAFVIGIITYSLYCSAGRLLRKTKWIFIREQNDGGVKDT